MAEKNKSLKVEAEPARQRQTGQEYLPLVDIYETKNGTTVVEAEVPGASEDSVDIRVEKGVLTISAEALLKEPEGYDRTYAGFLGGRYFRAFALSDEIDRDKIEASLADGVLTLRLPRGTTAKTHKIAIKSD